VVEAENDLIANLANTCACLKEQFSWLWVGFYIVKDNELVLGPFQGPLACTRIGRGKGVCGSSWEKKQSIIVADVNAFPGHIACSSLSVSEIVIPVIRTNNVVAVLDVDSELYNHFDEIDRRYLEEVVSFLNF
jgi:GAF domain-containing protein